MAKEKIVVIDDSPIVRKLAELALEEEGYKVYTAEDGEEGLRISEEIRPSVILVDFIMPRISGYQFCKSARENELLKDIPIILITGKGEDVGKKFEEKFGVVDYFIKPFKSEMLVEKVNSIVNAQRVLAESPESHVVAEEASMPKHDIETPVFSFDEMATGEAAGIAGVAMTGLTEEAAEPVLSLADEENAGVAGLEEPLGSDAIEEIPEFSFDSLESKEAPELESHTLADPELASHEFDFNLEGLTPQDIELVEEPEVIPHKAEIPAAYDFDAIYQFQPAAAVEELAASSPASFAGHNITLSEDEIERVVRRCFAVELPVLIQNSMTDILKQHGVIKPSTIVITGNLDSICVCEALILVSKQQLTGRFFVFSTGGSAEVYFDKGRIIYALTSRKGKILMTGQSVASLESKENIHESILETLSLIGDLKTGNFFFEKMSTPAALSGISQGKNVVSLLLESLRRRSDVAEIIAGSVFIKGISDAAAHECGLNEEEGRIFSHVDGNNNASQIASRAGIELSQALNIFDRLIKVGVLRYQGGV
ncbi:MAG TPA: response regulator [Dissulfurispiraceae bacterium]|nr:response regulator [Dissulfurispiraceae bacterium]